MHQDRIPIGTQTVVLGAELGRRPAVGRVLAPAVTASAVCSAAMAACSDARAAAMPRRPTSRVASSIRQAGGVSRRVSCRAMQTSQPRGCDSHARPGETPVTERSDQGNAPRSPR